MFFFNSLKDFKDIEAHKNPTLKQERTSSAKMPKRFPLNAKVFCRKCRNVFKNHKIRQRRHTSL